MSLFKKEVNKAHGKSVKEDIIEKDYRPLKVDARLREAVKASSSRFRGGIRLAHGYFLTDKERQEKLNKLRKVKLP